MAWEVQGSGTAYFRGANSCRVEFQVKNTATDEVRRERKTMRVKSKTKKEKERCIREFRAELEQGLNRDKRNVTFAEYAAEWISYRESKVAPRTLTKDANDIRRINMFFGDYRLVAIERADIKRFQAAITTADENGHAPTPSGRPLSGATAHGTCVRLKQILEDARKDGIIATNPYSDLKHPSVDTKEREPLTLNEVAKFRALLDAAEPRTTHPSLVGFRLCLFAGLRRGEVLGLRWGDFDSSAGTVTIERALCSETLKLKEPKTKTSYRTIPLDGATVDYLRRFKDISARALIARGRSVKDSPVVAQPGKAYMHPENFTRSLRDFCAANGLPSITPHVLRHTYCTMLFAAGANPKTVMKLMGHNDLETTIKIYAHYVETQGEQAVTAAAALIDETPVSNVILLDKPRGRYGIRAAV